jgi:hypothetical protein
VSAGSSSGAPGRTGRCPRPATQPLARSRGARHAAPWQRREEEEEEEEEEEWVKWVKWGEEEK